MNPKTAGIEGFYESDCQGRAPPFLIAWAFQPWRSAPLKVGLARWWVRAGQVDWSFSSSFSSLSSRGRWTGWKRVGFDDANHGSI